MGKLPSVKYILVLDFLQSIGYVIARQKGSHIRLHHKRKISVTVPAHDPVSKGVLRKILRDTGQSIEDVVSFLEK